MCGRTLEDTSGIQPHLILGLNRLHMRDTDAPIAGNRIEIRSGPKRLRLSGTRTYFLAQGEDLFAQEGTLFLLKKKILLLRRQKKNLILAHKENIFVRKKMSSCARGGSFLRPEDSCLDPFSY